MIVAYFEEFRRPVKVESIRKSAVDSAGYRPIASMVESFRRAGMQLDVFRAAEFSGDLELSPLHQNYIDPVDRDAALLSALEKAKKTRDDFDVARRAAIDKRKKAREDEIMRLAERIRGVRGEKVESKASPAEEQASS